MQDLKTITDSIDHSLLRPTLTERDVITEVQKVISLEVASFCVMPCYLKVVQDILKVYSSKTKLSTVIGFPHGNIPTQCKIDEMQRHDECGYFVEEYDVFINFSKVLSGKWSDIATEVKELNNECKRQGALLKVIFETCYLEDRHIITLCELCADVMPKGYVKTSTGFGSGGATFEHIKLMKEHSKHLGVKASGGVKTLGQAEAMITAGATRIGATSTIKIVEEWIARDKLIKDGKYSDEPPF